IGVFGSLLGVNLKERKTPRPPQSEIKDPVVLKFKNLKINIDNCQQHTSQRITPSCSSLDQLAFPGTTKDIISLIVIMPGI
ncbi:hypothetical protein D5086_021723, partial [Populus alba]